MRVSEFDFHLPPELIAQSPASPRDHSRLLHLKRGAGTMEHRRFDALPDLLRPDDLLVFNDTRVLRARLRGWKLLSTPTGESERGARVEALLLGEREPGIWEALLKPSSRLREGTPLLFASDDGASDDAASDDRVAVHMHATALARTETGWLVRFEGDIRAALPQLGEVPLPPYISGQSEEADYQTVYARLKPDLESAAAPTAGLHFMPRTFEALESRGIESAFVTLQIGIGTFRPMQVETLDEHEMHRENYFVESEAAARINAHKARGGRIVAVGTTAVRVLESAWQDGRVQDGAGATRLFIRPGHRFRAVDALVTNFHLPRSSLLVMISAFAGRDAVRQAYDEAIALRYRFFSFGDAMFIE